MVDPRVRNFAFRVLRQNRRVVTDESRRAELELFHEVLTDISMCRSTQSVRDFIIAAYVRGASTGNAEHTSLEGNTAVFTKRRYRDAWNRCVTRRVSKSHNHSVKIKAKVRARGTRGQNWYGDKRVSFIRSKVRTQSAWLLHLAGDFHGAFETKEILHRPHHMRVMLTSNLAVDQRFANGTQGRLLHWSPAEVEGSKAVPASHPDISARFVKESAVQKRGQWLPDIDFMDCLVRQENLNIRGDPLMLQLSLVPAYALTVHKTQALSIKHLVLGCVVLSCTRASLHVSLSKRALRRSGAARETDTQRVICVVGAGG